MRTIGIICECNPLHKGHLYLLERARASGAEAVIAVMSGCFVQRGEAAVADPYARAEILVRAGFDAVFELPFPFSAASSEFFGHAGVEILSRLGADELWFGSECGDVETLARCAEIAESEAFAARYKESTQTAGGTAAAYFNTLRELCKDADVAFDPNDILGISYLRALRRLGAKMRPVTVKRQGSGYAETALSQSGFPSATALRRAWREDGLDAITPYLPSPCAEILLRESAKGHAPADLHAVENLILGALRLCDSATLETVAELDGGLGNRLSTLSHKALSLDGLLSLCATKKYTDARIRRGILFALTRVGESDLRREIAYTRLLAANRTGCAFLASVRKSATLPVVTRQTDLPENAAACAQFALEARERALYALTQPTRGSGEVLMRRTSVILE